MFGWVLATALALSVPAQAGVQADLPAPAPASTPAPVTPVAIEPEPEPPPLDQVTALPAELRQRLRDEVLAGRMSQFERLQRLVDFMFLPQGLGLVYEEDATHTVAQAYATRRGNCVAFTLMFLALARETGLKAWPQEIEESLSWHLRDDTLYRTNHVNAGVRAGGSNYRVDASPLAVIARHPPERISEQRLLAHYYDNHAVAAMQQGQLPLALRYVAIALDLDPGYASTWSNAGVLFLRSGDQAEAERHYDKALSLDPDNTGALFNMLGLQQRKGDRRREAVFRKRLEQVQGRDPFHQFLLAMDYQRSGDLANAITHFRRAIRLYPREYRFHAALAATYRQAGDIRRADKALARARMLGGDAMDGPASPPGETAHAGARGKPFN
jgi:Flp pilus assembly protein TadD